MRNYSLSRQGTGRRDYSAQLVDEDRVLAPEDLPRDRERLGRDHLADRQLRRRREALRGSVNPSANRSPLLDERRWPLHQLRWPGYLLESVCPQYVDQVLEIRSGWRSARCEIADRRR